MSFIVRPHRWNLALLHHDPRFGGLCPQQLTAVVRYGGVFLVLVNSGLGG